MAVVRPTACRIPEGIWLAGGHRASEPSVHRLQSSRTDLQILRRWDRQEPSDQCFRITKSGMRPQCTVSVRKSAG